MQYAGGSAVDPNTTLGGYPVLKVRKLVRRLNNLLFWTTETVQVILRTEHAEAHALVRVLADAGLAVPEPDRGVETWRTTQLAQTFGSATAAKPITRETADRALSQLIERVNRVNRDEHFLAKVTKVVVLGSYLRPEIDRLSDLDIAVELQPKERDWDRLREQTQERVEQIRTAGHRFGSWLEAECWWHMRRSSSSRAEAEPSA
jgi:predicted nucleotidyltransferase